MIFKMEFLDTMVDLRACSAGCLFRDGFIFREVIHFLDLISLVHHAGLILERGRLMAVDLLAEVVNMFLMLVMICFNSLYSQMEFLSFKFFMLFFHAILVLVTDRNEDGCCGVKNEPGWKGALTIKISLIKCGEWLHSQQVPSCRNCCIIFHRVISGSHWVGEGGLRQNSFD